MAKKLTFSFPETWNKLTNKQLIKVAKLFFSKNSTVIFDEKLFKILVNCKWYKFRLRRKIILLFKNVPLSEIKKHYFDFYENQNLTRFISSFKLGKHKYYAPLDRLSNLTIGELSVAEDLFLGYQNNAENKAEDYGSEYLRYLTALLYVQSNSPTRPKFIKENLSSQVEKLKKLKPEIVFATALSYKGCKDYISSLPKYKKIFPKVKKSKAKTQKLKKSSSGLGDLILAMSGKTFGDYEQTFNTNVYTFLDNYVRELNALPNGNTTTNA